MSAADINGIRIAYREEGSGEPLVLVRGYASAGALWHDQVPDLAEHFRVITMDNRGTGDSDKPVGPYTIQDMAGDLVGLIRRLDAGPVHALGISMGGMIVMQAALDQPDALRSLVLGCTTCSARRGITRDPEVLKRFVTLRDATDEENIRRSVPVLFSQRTIREKPEVIERHVSENLEHRSPHATFKNHDHAVQRFDLCHRLGEIRHPVLIAHGEGDLLIPPEMAEQLHQGIPGSRIHLFPDLGHLFFMEEPAEFNRTVISFLKSLTR